MSGETSYGGYPGQGHPHQSNPYGDPVGTRPKNGAGLAALILGIVGLLLCWLVIGVLPAVIGLVLGVVALRRVRRGLATNRGVAITGLVLSVLATLASLAFLAAYVWFANFAVDNGGPEYAQCVSSAAGDQAAIDACTQQFGDGLMDRLAR